jgi:cold shock CspA family protein
MRLTGVVHRIPDPLRCWGFILGQDGQESFFHVADVIRDRIGRRYLRVGTPVEFDRDEEAKARARAIVNIDPALEAIDQQYAEDSQVSRFDGRVGFLTRSSLDELFFSVNRILSLGTLRVGSWVKHHIRQNKDGKWHATCIEIYKPAPH